MCGQVYVYGVGVFGPVGMGKSGAATGYVSIRLAARCLDGVWIDGVHAEVKSVSEKRGS